MTNTVGAVSNRVVAQIFRIFAEMRNEARDQRQRHRDVAAEHMAERQVADRAVLLLRQRRIVLDDVRGRGEMLAVGDQRALGMAGGAGGVDDEGRGVRVQSCATCCSSQARSRRLGLREQRVVSPSLRMA